MRQKQNNIADILLQLSGVRRSGGGWIARCPAHDDKTPSLSFTITESGRLLAHCFSGCSFEEIRLALRLSGEHFFPSSRPIETGHTQEQVATQEKAVRLWKSARPADVNHHYLSIKKIKPFHSRQIGTSLVVPMQDASGTLWNLQFIGPDGRKVFLKGGRTKSLFTVIGEPFEGRIYIAEGFATAATVHELTEDACFVAFSASNLPAVAQVVRRSFPDEEIVLAADADPAGERYSEEAARAIDGLVAYAGRVIDGR